VVTMRTVNIREAKKHQSMSADEIEKMFCGEK
jgi:hypothetical protein